MFAKLFSGSGPVQAGMTRQRIFWSVLVGLALYFLLITTSHAHGIAEGDKGYIQEISGVHFLAFVYLGAKHMFTGYDHILFLFGVIFSSTGSRISGCMSASLRSAIRPRCCWVSTSAPASMAI